MRLLGLIFVSLFFFLTAAFYFPKDVFADCTGQYPVESGSCDLYCSSGQTWTNEISFYDCPSGQTECLPQNRHFVCSYPRWYSDSNCQNSKSDTSCGSTYCSKDAASNNTCGPNGTDPCKCSPGSVCVDNPNYTSAQLCTGQFQESTHGGCVSASCGFFCYVNECHETFASDSPSLQQLYILHGGAQTYAQCSASCGGCTPNAYDQFGCRYCNSQGTGWIGAEGSNWGSGENVTQWCACADRYGAGAYNSTNYPACFPATPTVNLSASPSSITNGGTSTLSWSSTNTTSCTASNGWSGAKAVSGSQGVSPTATTTYTITCTGAGGNASQSATVTVSAAPPPPADPVCTVRWCANSCSNGNNAEKYYLNPNGTWGAYCGAVATANCCPICNAPGQICYEGGGGGGTTCPGSCGDSNYGGLPSCPGGWAYAANSSYDQGCASQSNVNSYCYTCTASPPPTQVCIPGTTQSVNSSTQCSPGSTTTSP